MKKYSHWTEDDKNKLFDIIQCNKTHTGRIYWDEVAKQFQGRTIQQCKSFYRNYQNQFKDSQKINSVKDEETTKSHPEQIFTRYQFIKLYFCINVFGLEWQLIRESLFKDKTVEDLQQAYEFIKIREQEATVIFKQFLESKPYSLQLAPHLLCQLLVILSEIDYRNKFFAAQTPDKPIVKLQVPLILQQMQVEDSLLYFYPPDMLEKAFYNKVDQNFNLQLLLSRIDELQLMWTVLSPQQQEYGITHCFQ
ncbi:Myb-like_DNA-binding domain-containing protein [Hexamita inflata]|uniref:Myb-like DNA-binding domain-containing protein n=1 Tax=Hexamita inflata TaxID=28002 RepID=A0AA86Q3G1_9EUKA|nr:Myb-like DNA-binding domain-containing protein [Hexamita inflata]